MPLDSPTPAPSARRAVPLPASLRQHRCAVARWALAAGRPLQIDAITVIIAVRRFEAGADGTPFRRWTAANLAAFLWGSAIGWCEANEVEVPRGLTESLWTYLSFLAAEGELAAGSSSISQLRAVLVDTGGLTRSGRSRVAPGGRLATTRRLEHAARS